MPVSDFTACPVCFLDVDPTIDNWKCPRMIVAPCGHSQCIDCYNQGVLAHRTTCPTCKHPISFTREPSRNFVLEAALENMYQARRDVQQLRDANQDRNVADKKLSTSSLCPRVCPRVKTASPPPLRQPKKRLHVDVPNVARSKSLGSDGSFQRFDFSSDVDGLTSDDEDYENSFTHSVAPSDKFQVPPPRSKFPPQILSTLKALTSWKDAPVLGHKRARKCTSDTTLSVSR